MKCHCGKEFDNYRALNGHKSVHSRGEEYANKRSGQTFTCRQCGVTQKTRNSKRKYCSLNCQRMWQWENITVPDIEAGKKTCNATQTLKRYLIQKDGERCKECNLGPQWKGKPLSLHLDHIDGNSDNNFPNNIRLLCPNCHTQTENYGSKGLGNRYRKDTQRNKYIREYHKRTNSPLM